MYLYQKSRAVPPIYLKHLKRIDEKERVEQQWLSHYHLKGVLAPACGGLEIYQMHFISCFKKDKEDAPSDFYKVFIDYIYLHGMMSQVGRKDKEPAWLQELLSRKHIPNK
jgi:hypothetical protein